MCTSWNVRPQEAAFQLVRGLAWRGEVNSVCRSSGIGPSITRRAVLRLTWFTPYIGSSRRRTFMRRCAARQHSLQRSLIRWLATEKSGWVVRGRPFWAESDSLLCSVVFAPRALSPLAANWSQPLGWAEWNDKYRDALRSYWKGDGGVIGELAYRITGSSDLYARSGRRPYASINFVTAHDGFTL